MQCSAYNDRPLVAGNSYRWTTFHGGSNPCELSCLAQGHNFYYNFGRVLDGTACSKEPGDVCVNGKCLTPGCDLILGSDQQEDACMVCGGQNSTCLHHRSVYQNAQGAANFSHTSPISIENQTHSLPSFKPSLLPPALQNGRSQFVINGNWKISVPGEYSVAGTKLLYKRSVDTWESFEVPGPTMEDLHVMVLVTDRNPGIEYEYWLPPDRYALFHGRRSQLREPHHTAIPSPPSSTTPSPVPSPTCPSPKLYRGEETRYDVQIIHTYHNRFRLEHREFLWVPNVCDCPSLEEGRQYVLMVRRHINNEQTLNRILMEEDSYAIPYKPREDALLRPLEDLCSNRGPRPPAELRGGYA
uniref:ADAMTS like 5 n=1 Tax=Oncorhynchus kisutch TaxID=8019 RepID=A0A8C7LE89_ONCKI